jgi:hypothetical protein
MSARSFEDAKTRNRLAADALAEVAAGKRRAATRAPGADTFAQTAASARANRNAPWAESPDAVFGANTPASAKRTS